MTGSELCRWIERSVRGLGPEIEVQAALDRALYAEGVKYEREVYLDARSRIDFLFGGIGIEVKVDGSLATVTRQLHRYARFEKISELVLVTTRVQLARVPKELNKKPVHVAALLGGIV